MIFVSTGGYRQRKAYETAIDFYNHGINCVELSGGLYSSEVNSELKSLPSDLNLQVHNYFPPPCKPFVFNLASTTPEVVKKSAAHAKSAMQLAVELKRPIYSFHAGFRINPKVVELGQKLGRHSLESRDTALNIFGEQVLTLAEHARVLGVILLVENNVLNNASYQVYGEDPLLLTEPIEMIKFFEKMPSNVRLLMDVAHLKVSSTTLGFNLISAHALLQDWISAYHLSDNNGLEDSNGAVGNESWFWDLLKPNLDYYSLEVYKISTENLLEQVQLTNDKLAKK